MHATKQPDTDPSTNPRAGPRGSSATPSRQTGPSQSIQTLVAERLSALRGKAEALRREKAAAIERHSGAILDQLSDASAPLDRLPDPAIHTDLKARLARIDRELADVEAALVLGDQALSRAHRQDTDRSERRVSDVLEKLEADRRKLTRQVETGLRQLTDRIAGLDALAARMEDASGSIRNLPLRSARNGNAQRLAGYVAARLSMVLPPEALTQALLNAKATRGKIGDRKLADLQTDLHAAWRRGRRTAGAAADTSN